MAKTSASWPDGAPLQRTPTTGPGSSQLARTGAVIGGLAGALAGLVEARWTAGAIRSATVFGEVFGYAVLLDAVVFALLGAGLTVLASWVLGVTRASSDADWTIALGAGLVCLAIGACFLLVTGPRVGDGRPDLTSGARAIAGVWAGLALLVGVALTPWRGSSGLARLAARRIAPILLLLILGAALVGIVRDLDAHGFAQSGSARPHLSAQRSAASQPTDPARQSPMAADPAQPEPGGGPSPSPAPRPTVTVHDLAGVAVCCGGRERWLDGGGASATS